MRRYVGAMVVAAAMIAVVGVAGVSKAQAAPGFFNFSIGNSGYGPAGYSASFGSYAPAPPVPYCAPRPICGPVPYGAAYGGVPYMGGYRGPAYGAYYRAIPPVPYYGGYRGYGPHNHHGYRGW
jgi:hypothetical protein